MAVQDFGIVWAGSGTAVTCTNCSALALSLLANLRDVILIDRTAIDRLCETVGSDPQSLVEMIDCFLEEGPSLVRQISESAASGDFVLLRRSAHSLKSNARDFGATALAELCAALEDDLRQDKEPADSGAQAALVRAQWQQVEGALRDIAVEWGR